jgi:hypothetical protein
MMNGKGLRRKGSWLNWSTVPEFVWDGWVTDFIAWATLVSRTGTLLSVRHVICVLLSKLSLSTPWRHVEGVEVQLHSFLTRALNGGVWPASRLKKEPAYPWDGGSSDLQSLSRRFGEGKNVFSLPAFEHGTLQSAVYLLNLWSLAVTLRTARFNIK